MHPLFQYRVVSLDRPQSLKNIRILRLEIFKTGIDAF